MMAENDDDKATYTRPLDPSRPANIVAIVVVVVVGGGVGT